MIDVTLEKIRNLAKSDASFKDAIIKTAKEKPSCYFIVGGLAVTGHLAKSSRLWKR